MESSLNQFERLLANAKAGDESSLGELLSTYRNLLRVLAGVQIGRHLRGKVDASDIVQETYLEAHRAISRFIGSSEPQFAQWLKSILAARLANTFRHYLGVKQRDVRMEQQIQEDLDKSAMSLAGLFVDPRSSPSQQVVRNEQSRLVVEALSRLPIDYQTVLVLRHLEGLTFPAIAERMDRSLDSVEKLWMRGLAKLKKEFVG